MLQLYYLWIPFCFKRSQMSIKIMTMHYFSAWGVQITKYRIPYTKTIVLWCSQDFAARQWREICWVNNSFVCKVIEGRSSFHSTQIPYTSLRCRNQFIRATIMSTIFIKYYCIIADLQVAKIHRINLFLSSWYIENKKSKNSSK